MRADIHDGPEQMLQAKAGYIDARPLTASSAKPLATHGRTIHLGQSRRVDRRSATFAVGTRVTSRPPHRSVRAQFGHTACMGLSLSRGRHAILVVLCIPFFCSTRAASF